MKRFFKNIVYGIATLAVLPLAGFELLARRMTGRDVWFYTQGQLLSLVPGKIGYFLRNAYYHLTLQRCPLHCFFDFGTIFTHSETEVGDAAAIGMHCVIGLATIGDYVMLGEGVHILSGNAQHGTDDPVLPYQEQPGKLTRILIGRNAWIGAGSMLTADVGSNCVVGAGSVVQRAIPDDMVALGNPARPIRKTSSSSAAEVPTETHA